MEKDKAENIFSEVVTKTLRLKNQFVDIHAIGVSGSHARNTVDKLSDIDLCIFTDSEIPAAQNREDAYSIIGFANPIYFDVDFESSRGDGFNFKNVRCDFNWMSISRIKWILKILDTDFDSPEFVPGGLQIIQEIDDPNSVIAELKKLIPQYSDNRAKYRIRKAIKEIHYSFYDLEWLKKAVYRNDTYLFMKYKYAALQELIKILFALNKAWLADEKGLVNRLRKFVYLPVDIDIRMNDIIMHQNDSKDLRAALINLKDLCSDTVTAIHERYPNLNLPQEWP